MKSGIKTRLPKEIGFEDLKFLIRELEFALDEHLAITHNFRIKSSERNDVIVTFQEGEDCFFISLKYEHDENDPNKIKDQSRGI